LGSAIAEILEAETLLIDFTSISLQEATESLDFGKTSRSQMEKSCSKHYTAWLIACFW